MIKHSKLIFAFFFFYVLIANCFAEIDKVTASNVLEKIDQIAKNSNSIVGVTAIHIENEEKLSYNGNKLFFMASTIKVPIAIVLLQRVDQQQESLDRLIHLTPDNSIPGSGHIAYLLNKKSLDISLLRLLNLMMQFSDNTASDAILRQVNGPDAVFAALSRSGIHSILIKRSILQMYLDAHGADNTLLQQPHTSLSIEEALNAIPLNQQIQAWKVFQDDFRDSTTPDDMALLLVKLYQGQLLSPQSTQYLLRLMQHCRTGSGRIRGLLPGNTVVAHKTGTWSIYSRAFLTNPDTKQLLRFVSDVGIITLPNNKGHVALAVYVKSNATSDYTRSRVIAEVTRQIFDYYAYDGNPPPEEKKASKAKKKRHKKK